MEGWIDGPEDWSTGGSSDCEEAAAGDEEAEAGTGWGEVPTFLSSISTPSSQKHPRNHLTMGVVPRSPPPKEQSKALEREENGSGVSWGWKVTCPRAHRSPSSHLSARDRGKNTARNAGRS